MNSTHNFNETRATTGLNSALFVKRANETKYYLFMPGTETPFPGGSYDTVEISILQSKNKGKLLGKMNIDDEEVKFMLHRDNVVRMQEYTGEQLDFLSVTPDGLGYKSTGTVEYSPDNATEGDPLTGTYTIAYSGKEDKATIDIRPYVQDTILFNCAIPVSINVDNAEESTINIVGSESGYTLDVKVLDNDGKDMSTYFTITNSATSETTNKNSTIKFSSIGTGTQTIYACAYVTIKKSGFASWTTTILLETHKGVSL